MTTGESATSARAPMTLDWTAFTAPLPAHAVQQWKAAAKAAGHPWASSGIGQTIALFVLLIPMVLLFAVFGLFLVGGGIVTVVGSGAEVGSVLWGLFLAVTGLLCLALVAVGIWALVTKVPNDARWRRWVRLDWFARTNRLLFSPADPNPNYPGAIFAYGSNRAAVDHFRSTEGRFFDLGNFRYVVSTGKSSTTITWGFLALNLERRLPHMLLDSVQNNRWSTPSLSGMFDRSQVLSLEGDFDRWFTLYCPRQYERDALYVFTPDLMALCIDEVAPFDVEIVDDWMLVYSPRPFRMDDPALLERLFRIVDVVGSKALKQTRRYRDENAASPEGLPAAFEHNVVAPRGRRLRRRFPVAVIVVLILVLLAPVMGAVIAVITALPSVSGG